MATEQVCGDTVPFTVFVPPDLMAWLSGGDRLHESMSGRLMRLLRLGMKIYRMTEGRPGAQVLIVDRATGYEAELTI